MDNHEDSVCQSNPRKRRRPALSCEQCRRRKVRCDREMPCGPCTKIHPSLKCLYVKEGKAALDARIESAPDEDEENSILGPETSQPSSQSVDSRRIAQLERSVRALQGRVHELEGLQGPGRQEPGSKNVVDGHDGTRSSQSEQPQTFIPPLAPRIKSDCGNMKVFGTTHWAIVFQQFRLLRQVKNTASWSDAEHNEISMSLAESRKLRHHIKNRQAPRLVDPAPGLLNDLPSRRTCDELVQHYFCTLELIYRVVHIPSFYREYENFWDEPQSASRSFVFKLLLILAIGSVFHCKPGPLNELGLPVQRWAYAAQWWLSGPFQKEIGNLEGLQVYCLLLICRQAYAMGKETNWMSAGKLLRMAINQGLHRDPSHFATISIFDGEMRRRIWATIIELNIQFSIDSAMPPLISEGDFDTRPPANVDDEELDQSITILPPLQLPDIFTVSSLQILLLKSFPTRLKIAKVINECNGAQVYERALQLGNGLTTACKEMAGLMHTYISRTRKSRFKPTPFHHRIMDTVLRRFLLNLHRPFTIQASKDPRFYLSRKISLDSALIMASYGDIPIVPGTELQPYQYFQRLALSGAGSFKAHLSLDVIIVISLELITQIEEDYSAQPSGSSPITPTAVDQISQAARVPLVQALDRIKGHLYESLAAGIPSTKRYCLLAGVLAQIESVPLQEQAEWAHIREAFMTSMNVCQSLLQNYIHENASADGEKILGQSMDQMWTPESGLGSSLSSDLMFPDLGFEGLNFWDLPPFVDTSAFEPPL
ncbi:uncharacterized protein N7483_009234 [Penicillium malachiteum]|uniref:uncharacterized protein n=1 Tax=Penicillium malachiteum TaxID=1324776 RepID=UPI002546C955|nr:uncharacterized protein N7483_009234 [Penicillium malachiteum]KAJ5721300.1 hypothetical protein N7483_009234 [Penicillium malachiteum]